MGTQPPPALTPPPRDSDDPTLSQQQAEVSKIVSLDAPLSSWLSIPQRGLNELSSYFTGHTLTHWAHKGIQLQATAMGLGKKDVEQGVGLLSKAMGGDEGKGKVASAMIDEATKLGAEMGTSPMTYLLPASKAAGLLFVPGALAGAAEHYGQAQEQFDADGGKLTPEVGRALIRGTADAASYLGTAAHLSSFEFPKGAPGKRAWELSVAAKEGGGEGAAAGRAPGPPPVGTPDPSYDQIAQKIEDRSLKNLGNPSSKVHGQLANHMLSSHGGILLENVRGGGDFWADEPLAEPGIEQRPFRRAFTEAYLKPSKKAEWIDPKDEFKGARETWSYDPHEVLQDVPGVSAQVERFAKTLGTSTDPQYLSSGYYNAVYKLGKITKGPHAGERAVLRVSAEQNTPWPKSDYVVQPIGTHVTPEGIRMDIVPEMTSPKEHLKGLPPAKQAQKFKRDFQELGQIIELDGMTKGDDALTASDLHSGNVAYDQHGLLKVIDPGALIPEKMADKASSGTPEERYALFDRIARGVGPIATVSAGLAAAKGALLPPPTDEKP